MTVLVEGKGDKALLRELLPLKIVPKAVGSIGDVSDFLEKNSGCWAMIDEDPKGSQPTYFKELGIRKIKSKNGIIFLDDKQKNHNIIVICPKLEDWIIKSVKDVSIDLKEFGFSSTPSDLKANLNSMSKNSDKFKELIQKLLKLKSPSILYLKSLLDKIPK